MQTDIVKPEKRNIYVSLWTGEEKLWKAYWLFFVAGNYVLTALADLLLRLGNKFVLITYLITLIIYFVWSVIVVWKCAPNASSKVWTYLARVIVTLGSVAAIYVEFT
jgi:hypothetical protein